MKKLFLFLAVGLLCVSGLFAQKANDFFIYKSGQVVNCIILDIDSVDNSIKYKLNNQSSIKFESLDKILTVQNYKSEANDGSIKDTQAQTENTPFEGELRLNANQMLDLAGYQLTKFAKKAQTGNSLMLMGTIISVCPLLIKDSYGSTGIVSKSRDDLRLTFAGIGIAVSTIGVIVQYISFSHARNAGKLMQLNDKVSLNATQDGIGLAMKIKLNDIGDN